ncbi:MAG: ubiquinone-dependent pyruvate dehydrogenase, partial [Acidimicrobiia bacterium]
MAVPNVATHMIEALADAGVQRVYGVVGDSLNSVTEAVRRHPDIDWIGVRHEETGAFAAGAEAQLTGELAVCAGSSGPGAIHLVNGLYDAHRSLAPVLAIAAHIPSGEIGTGYFQESHPDRLFVDCSHYSELIASARQMPRTLQVAMQNAIAKGGVSVIVLPGDIAQERMEQTHLVHPMAETCTSIRPCQGDLQRLAALLNAGDRVTILAGAGCARAHDELMQLAETLKAPIVHAMRGKEWVEYDNPYDVGMTGLIGFASGHRALMRCDVLVMLGTDFPYTDWYPTGKTIVQVDLRAHHLGRRCGLTLGVQGDVKETIVALLPELEAKADRSHLDDSLRNYAKARRKLDRHVKGIAGRRPIHPEYLTATINELASDDAVFTVDVGMATVWAARYLRMTRDRRLLGSFTHGSMANALPQAIGAQARYPGRQVISLSGDGGFTMAMGDFITLLQHDLPVKVVIYDNGSLGLVKLEQNVAGLPDFGTELNNPNFAKVAEAMGATGIRVEDPSEVRPALERALATDGPVLVDVLTNPSELA